MTTQEKEKEVQPRVVDLGCGLGNHLGEFVKLGANHFLDDPMIRVIQPGECLGLDAQAGYEQDLVGRGYQFQQFDVLASGAVTALPEADYYLVWEFLDTLPTRDWADAIVKAAIHRSKKGAWFRLRTFETDPRGEGLLRDLNLRFAWTANNKHPTHYLLVNLVQAVNQYKQESGRNSTALKIKPGRRLHSTEDLCVVPLDTPPTVDSYSSSKCKPKPHTKLVPPPVANWDVIVTV